MNASCRVKFQPRYGKWAPLMMKIRSQGTRSSIGATSSLSVETVATVVFGLCAVAASLVTFVAKIPSLENVFGTRPSARPERRHLGKVWFENTVAFPDIKLNIPFREEPEAHPEQELVDLPPVRASHPPSNILNPENTLVSQGIQHTVPQSFLSRGQNSSARGIRHLLPLHHHYRRLNPQPWSHQHSRLIKSEIRRKQVLGENKQVPRRMKYWAPPWTRTRLKGKSWLRKIFCTKNAWLNVYFYLEKKILGGFARNHDSFDQQLELRIDNLLTRKSTLIHSIQELTKSRIYQRTGMKDLCQPSCCQRETGKRRRRIRYILHRNSWSSDIVSSTKPDCHEGPMQETLQVLFQRIMSNKTFRGSRHVGFVGGFFPLLVLFK